MRSVKVRKSRNRSRKVFGAPTRLATIFNIRSYEYFTHWGYSLRQHFWWVLGEGRWWYTCTYPQTIFLIVHLYVNTTVRCHHSLRVIFIEYQRVPFFTTAWSLLFPNRLTLTFSHANSYHIKMVNNTQVRKVPHICLLSVVVLSVTWM